MYVSPRKDCSHIITDKILPLHEFKKISFQNLKCECCSEINELWICITCGKSFCGRYVNNHYYDNHYKKDKSHGICISMLDLSVWCYQCITDGFKDPGSYIESPLTSEYVKIISDFKFGDSSSISKTDINSTLGISKEKSSKIKYDNFIELLKNNTFKNITFLVGPGINIDKKTDKNIIQLIFEKTKEKHEVFEIINYKDFFTKDLFISNPNLLYTFLKEFKLNEKEYCQPNINHYFIRFLIEKNLGYYVFTENFEGNEVKCGLLQKNVVFGRGNLLEDGHCVKCNKKINIKLIDKGIEEVKIVKCDKCDGPCKPKIILDGEEIDKNFYIQSDNILHCDLIFIIGTDLCSPPFSEILSLLNINDPWIVMINTKESGIVKFNDDFSSKELFVEGNCEDIVKKIIKDCGWNKEFNDKYKIDLDK